MTAAGDAVLAVARSTIGMAEDPPGSNAGPWWDWYGGNYGSWCACAVSWWCHMAGVPMCPVDSGNGFILVSNGTVHSYEGFEAAQEAQPTVALEPGDVVLFSWYSWDWSDGIPIITDPEWYGWVAGDHTGVVAVPPDSSGYFTAVEGNTSGGVVAERSDRHISQVCGWWRPLNYGEAATPTPPPEEDEMTEADWARMAQIINDVVANVWRAEEMFHLDKQRAHEGGHNGCLDVVRSEEFDAIVQQSVRRATGQ